ncbi:hypothetical protein NIES2119_27925 [[Phormidium ambiguum] IAM M-71]|uniref:Circadian input-output histidine kinase CikA n=1 Tax=[Phormidium ambiguum] IAM M-71 TaxID=454136 RepID=A0A1U7I647_9CYAN|nr:PAS domain-containing protein [Phormidium ambiguum]OKH31800.1 hypothetical protein NIES2119_27925 [Phormidium ambiguum IAM M-71]
MTDSLQRFDSPQNCQTITEADVLITEVLASRSAREPDLAAENEALRTLAQHLTDEPQSLLKNLVRMALDLCRADTVGVSLLETVGDEESVLRWVAIAGKLESLEQTTIPSNFSPCGTTLALNQPQLYSYPERYFTYLAHPQFPFVEALIIPLSVNDRALGTLWISSHDRARHFDAEDRRLMMSLGGFTASALYTMQQLQQKAEKALRQSEEMNQQILDSSDDCIKVLDLEGRIRFMSQGGQALLGIQDITPFLNKPWAEFWQNADREVIIEAIDRARAGEVCTFQGYCPTLKGEPKFWDSKISPIRNAQGQIEQLLCISRDITDRMRLEEERRRSENERKQAQEKLQESEEKYHKLFNSIDEGFCLIEVLFDETGKANDYRFLETNPAFEKHTGLVDAIGKTMREFAPQHETHWFEIYGEIALTGVPARFENSANELGRFYDVFAFRIGEPHDRQVAVLFNDISDRKQAEKTLEQAHNALRQQANQLEQVNQTLLFTLENLQIREEELRQQNEELAIARELAEVERQRYQDLFNFAPDGYVVTDATGMIQEANQAIAALIAIEQHYLVNTPLAIYISQPDRRAFRNLLYELHQQSGVQKLQTDEFSLQRSGGEDLIPVAIAGTAVCDAQGQIVGVRWLIRDISQRRQAEAEREQLLANERHYTNQLQGLTSAALAMNSALSVEEVLQVITNQAASIIGTHQSVTSMTIDQNWAQAIDCIYLSDKYAAWRDYKERPDGSGIYTCVCHLNRPMRLTHAELETHPRWKGFGKAADKHPPLRGWLAAPLVGRDGKNIGLIQLSDKYEGEFTQADESILVQLAQMASVAVENARLYEAEQQARAAAEALREEAQAANRVKDEFLAVLSHELRSPLNPILGWSKLLKSRKLDEAKTLQALSTIERNAKLQSELIEDLLDVSRILQGKLNLNVYSVNLVSVIRGAMETVRLAAEAKSIDLRSTILEAEYQNPQLMVLGDSTRLQQVIWNLLSNAVKFTPEGGRVEINLSLVNPQEQKTDDKQLMTTYAQITVNDNGVGIPPNFLPFVFDYFRQANATTTRKFGGLGLGLAIVRHLVELHGGTVKVESPGVGMGATFTIKLPLMPIPAITNQSDRSSESSPDLKGIQVLIVDDEPDSREFVAFVLEQAGAQVIAATTANEALTTLIRSQPDILLSDIGMPDMDGYMLIQQVRALAPEQGGQIPAIALTAYAGDFNQQQALAVGFQEHLAKPIEPETLVAAILGLLS